MISNRPDRLSRAGFVLPTTVLLLLVVTLSAAALTYRAYSRSEQAIATREQRVITNAATPAIDRAKAKIEYMFQRDDRIPGGLPPSDVLAALMVKPGIDIDPSTVVNYGVSSLSEDVYTLPDETRIDLNGDNVVDNAWFFKTDINGDGTSDDNEVIAYSILVDDEGTVPNTTTTKKVTEPEDSNKAKALVTRTGPLSTSQLTSQCRAARAPEGGWQVVNGSKNTLQKNFQVDAFVLNRGAGSDLNRTVQTLEFQQAREASRGSKWGAWFRYDLELFPGPEFKWNGAMHSASNIFVHDNIKGYMVSSNASCIYSDTASEITLADEPDDPATTNVNEAFQGQFVRGATKTNSFIKGSNGTPEFHYYNGANFPKTGGNGLQLDDNSDTASERDSIKEKSGQTPKLQDVAVNPILLFTEGISKPIADSTWERDTTNWDNKADGPVKQRRIYNKRERKPFVDDLFRADNRWGPNPVYKNYNLRSINATDSSIVLGKDINATTYPGLTDGEELDGYWERQAIKTGTRLIMGQRLELGNTNGWNVNPTTGDLDPAQGDPLYPPNTLVGSTTAHPTTDGNNDTQKKYPGGATEVLQRRSLRDNLAAVQGMVVYHYTQSSGNYPVACMAMTSHPGTPTTVKNSRTFSNLGGTTVLNTNFLNGNGTNGWEFGFYSESNFASSLSKTSSLGIALRNLAYFAGDPKGGAPSFEPIQDSVQDSVVHPFPYFSMWGDFSPLRRIFDDYLDKTTGGRTYAQLSPADKATLHSAACTLGMLAYNLNNLDNEANFDSRVDAALPNQGAANQLGKKLWETFDDNYLAGCTKTPKAGGGNKYTYDCTNNKPTKSQIIAAATLSENDLKAIDALSDISQVRRDRAFGFTSSKDSTTIAAFQFNINNDTYIIPFSSDCHPDNAASVVSLYFNGRGGGLDDEKAGIALVCETQPKYPSLYYLFPKADHDQNGTQGQADAQPTTTEEYVNPASTRTSYIFDDKGDTSAANDTGVNAGYVYKALEPSTIALAPTAVANWKTPIAAAGVAFNSESMHIVDSGNTVRSVAFLDRAFFDGREQLNVRALDLDIDLLTDSSKKIGGDYWIADDKTKNAEGIVYAFREDAVREDEIVRPKNSSTAITPAYCSSLDSSASNPRKFNLTNDQGCRMRVEPGTTPVFQDPPLTSAKISLKPVDYYPDPERRPYGFRFVNGADVSDAKARRAGMTFVTDNAVYIYGNFNLHSSNGGTSGLIEEFTDTLYNKSWGENDFYVKADNTGRAASELNTSNFAYSTVDYWRPVEILADSVGILSSNFKNGTIADTFVTPSPTTDRGGTYSYQNQNRPYFEGAGTYNVDNWVQENEWTGRTTATGTEERDKVLTPVWVDRNGKYQLKTPATNAITDWTIAEFTSFGNSPLRIRNLIAANPTYVNATIVSGLVPSRPKQSYGGFHNFPRLNESWKIDNSSAKVLNISGAFLQLNFSTAATGPFDQDAWEKGEEPVDQEFIWFYEPPERRWGYDVGLQYVPPAPVSRRFVTYGLPRSEYYREVPVDDPYMMRLRCATYTSGGQTVKVDPNATNAQCSA